MDKPGISTTVIKTPITELIVRVKGKSVNAFPEVALTKCRPHRYRKADSLYSEHNSERLCVHCIVHDFLWPIFDLLKFSDVCQAKKCISPMR